MAPKVGDTVVVTTSAGLRARSGPNGAVITKNGKPVIRAKGYKSKITKIESAGGRSWAKAARCWYALEYLGKYTAPIKPRLISPVPGWRATTPWRKAPNNNTYWQARGYHTGTDWAAPSGARIVAVRAGRVHRRWDNVLGNVALLYADNGDTYWMCHTSQFKVPDGMAVRKGQTIALVGQTGTGAMGPHLHLERRNGHTTSWAGPDLDPLGGW